MKILFLTGFAGVAILGLYLLISASIWNSPAPIPGKFRRSIKVGAGTVLACVGAFLFYGVIQQSNPDPANTAKITLELFGCFLPFGALAAIGTALRMRLSDVISRKISSINKPE